MVEAPEEEVCCLQAQLAARDGEGVHRNGQEFLRFDFADGDPIEGIGGGALVVCQQVEEEAAIDSENRLGVG